jgi:hypothetical protein
MRSFHSPDNFEAELDSIGGEPLSGSGFETEKPEGEFEDFQEGFEE